MFNQQTPQQNNWNRPTIQNVLPKQQIRPMLPGRKISSIEEVSPNEIPMDGQPIIFPCHDWNTIYAKAWNQDGTMETVKYVPETSNQYDYILNSILERLDRIESMLQNRQPINKKRVEDSNQQRS